MHEAGKGKKRWTMVFALPFLVGMFATGPQVVADARRALETLRSDMAAAKTEDSVAAEQAVTGRLSSRRTEPAVFFDAALIAPQRDQR